MRMSNAETSSACFDRLVCEKNIALASGISIAAFASVQSNVCIMARFSSADDQETPWRCGLSAWQSHNGGVILDGPIRAAQENGATLRAEERARQSGPRCDAIPARVPGLSTGASGIPPGHVHGNGMSNGNMKCLNSTSSSCPKSTTNLDIFAFPI